MLVSHCNLIILEIDRYMNLKNRFNNSRLVAVTIGLLTFLTFSFAHADVAADIAKVRAQLAKMFEAVQDADIVAAEADNVFRIDFGSAYALSLIHI